MENKDKKLWDHHQSENRSHLINGYPRQDMISQFVLRYLPRGSSILEIGFGDGYLLNKNSLNGYNVYGQDLSEENIKLTKKQWGNNKIKFILGNNSGKFTFDDESLDGFIASEVLEHMDDNQLNLCISEIYRIIKKGGYIFLTFPAKEILKNNECICPNCGEIFHKWGHKQHWDEMIIKKKFGKFKIIEKKEFFNRYIGKSLLENIIGWIMFIIRNILNNFIDLEHKSYLVILKKQINKTMYKKFIKY